MEQSRIKKLFTINFGEGSEPQEPVFKKHGFLVWLLFWLFIVISRAVRKGKYAASLKAYQDKQVKLHNELHPEYAKFVENYLFEQSNKWTEDDLKIMEAWAEQTEKETHSELPKDVMMLVYKSKLMEKALNKSGMSLEEINVHAPAFIWGYDFQNGYYDTLNGERVASIVEGRFFFYTEKQLIICSLNKDFFTDNQPEKNTTEDYFYKHVAGIKVVEDTVVNSKTKAEFSSTYVVLNSAGDKARFPIEGKNAEAQVRSIKAVLNSKLD